MHDVIRSAATVPRHRTLAGRARQAPSRSSLCVMYRGAAPGARALKQSRVSRKPVVSLKKHTAADGALVFHRDVCGDETRTRSVPRHKPVGPPPAARGTHAPPPDSLGHRHRNRRASRPSPLSRVVLPWPWAGGGGWRESCDGGDCEGGRARTWSPGQGLLAAISVGGAAANVNAGERGLVHWGIRWGPRSGHRATDMDTGMPSDVCCCAPLP
jgi:hypothetical protein